MRKSEVQGYTTERINNLIKSELFGEGWQKESALRKWSFDNWADMGPVMQKEGIDIEWPEKHLGEVGQATKYLQGDTDIVVEFTSKGEGLLAVAVCYLQSRRVDL